MENRCRAHEREKPSPKSNGAGASSSCSNGGQFVQTPPVIPRSDPTNPYPTTFVQADTSSFKHVVQMLTGSSSETAKQQASDPKGHVIPPMKKQSFKLYERRGQAQTLKKNLMINTLIPGFSATRHHQETLSPSILDFPKLALNSPVTPLNDGRSSTSSEEDRAIADKGFYLHPSPRDAAQPQLLPLFPLTSPTLSGSSES